MERFINFVVDLTNDELYELVEGNAEIYFLQGGCFEFAKILKAYIKNLQIVISKNLDHCGVLYDGNIYDASGKVENKNIFNKASQTDLKYMEERFGIPEKQYIRGKRISDYIIDEIKECNIDHIIDSIEGEER